MKVPPMAQQRRAELLKIAEGLWGDLQRNELGGLSGINRPFYIVDTLKDVHRDGYAAGFAAALADAPILSKYHGRRGFDVERFIADYESWKRAAAAALADSAGREGE